MKKRLNLLWALAVEKRAKAAKMTILKNIFDFFLFLLQFDRKSNDASSTGDRTFYSRTNCYGPTRKNRINPYQQPGDAGFAWSDRELDETDEAALANLSLVTIRLMSIFLRSRHCCLTALSCYSNSAVVSHALSFFFSQLSLFSQPSCRFISVQVHF